MQLQNGSLRLFHLFGIDVFLHWSWLIIAYFRIKNPIVQYEVQAWAVAEYLSLFGIVLLHEFGHALAAGRLAAQLNGLFSGRWAASLTLRPHLDRARCSGVWLPARW